MPEAHDGGAWEHYPHGADAGVRGRGATVAEAFANAARAMTALITDPAGIRAAHSVRIECAAPDLELLLADWLNALIYEMATRDMLFSRFDVRVEDCRLTAHAVGEAVDRARHAPAVEVKGATLTGLRVAQDAAGRWTAECVVDV